MSKKQQVKPQPKQQPKQVKAKPNLLFKLPSFNFMNKINTPKPVDGDVRDTSDFFAAITAAAVIFTVLSIFVMAVLKIAQWLK